MTFVSIAFIVFFICITATYYLCPPRFRWALLLLGSCYFYSVFVPKYIFILFFIILVDFIFALWMERTEGGMKRGLFITSLVVTTGVLFVFKYFNFFNENIGALARLLDWNYSVEALSLILPLGLSFHTFQSLSYLIEVYRGTYPAERHLGIYALYIMFFPQLVAGPIERPAHLIPQFKKVVLFQKENLFSGIRLMAWGFFKKIVIADRLALSVTYIYANIGAVSGPSILFAMFAFAFQLYADFSGYTDIARGSARVLGISLVRNFDQPYFASSIAEFWRRWHVSLSSWFRDYVYQPLLWWKRTWGTWWLYSAIIITFLLTGIWHGAAWTYIVMGLLFGGYIVIGRLTMPLRQKIAVLTGLDRFPFLHNIIRVSITFALVSIGWVFFRSPDLPTAFAFLKQIAVGWNMSSAQFIEAYMVYPFAMIGMKNTDLALSLGFIGILLLVENAERQHRLGKFLERQSLFVRSILYSSLFLAIVLLGIFTASTFIYFQF